ncbi:HNH endonuclease [Lysinibacillus sp. NPDC056232]|uniref:HNH endonuclease n=1 Tax=Lysinibacillus sp. NPDC056232 TaxID=3345756 RepID=UPI0035D9EBFB
MREHMVAAKKFNNSKAWRDCRASYINSLDDELCEHCQANLGYIVDHIEEININNIYDPMITLNHKNLQFLCIECHNKKTIGEPKQTMPQAFRLMKKES